MDKTMFFRILNSEMELATGCTEPGAVALTGAYAGAELNKRGEVIRRMEVNASTNILKNAMAAGIPGTKYTGMGYASAIATILFLLMVGTNKIVQKVLRRVGE